MKKNETPSEENFTERVKQFGYDNQTIAVDEVAMEEKRYNVEIFEYATGKTYAVIGKNMSEKRAEKRSLTGLGRCNSNYGTRLVEVKK